MKAVRRAVSGGDSDGTYSDGKRSEGTSAGLNERSECVCGDSERQSVERETKRRKSERAEWRGVMQAIAYRALSEGRKVLVPYVGTGLKYIGKSLQEQLDYRKQPAASSGILRPMLGCGGIDAECDYGWGKTRRANRYWQTRLDVSSHPTALAVATAAPSLGARVGAKVSGSDGRSEFDGRHGPHAFWALDGPSRGRSGFCSCGMGRAFFSMISPARSSPLVGAEL